MEANSLKKEIEKIGKIVNEKRNMPHKLKPELKKKLNKIDTSSEENQKGG